MAGLSGEIFVGTIRIQHLLLIDHGWPVVILNCAVNYGHPYVANAAGTSLTKALYIKILSKRLKLSFALPKQNALKGIFDYMALGANWISFMDINL